MKRFGKRLRAEVNAQGTVDADVIVTVLDMGTADVVYEFEGYIEDIPYNKVIKYSTMVHCRKQNL
ncbi:hypothetical protein AB6A23_02905 [Paenibacillus tarimensis]